MSALTTKYGVISRGANGAVRLMLDNDNILEFTASEWVSIVTHMAADGGGEAGLAETHRIAERLHNDGWSAVHYPPSDGRVLLRTPEVPVEVDVERERLAKALWCAWWEVSVQWAKGSGTEHAAFYRLADTALALLRSPHTMMKGERER